MVGRFVASSQGFRSESALFHLTVLHFQAGNFNWRHLLAFWFWIFSELFRFWVDLRMEVIVLFSRVALTFVFLSCAFQGFGYRVDLGLKSTLFVAFLLNFLNLCLS